MTDKCIMCELTIEEHNPGEYDRHCQEHNEAVLEEKIRQNRIKKMEDFLKSLDIFEGEEKFSQFKKGLYYFCYEDQDYLCKRLLDIIRKRD